jgi:hypothetical protein
MHNQDKHIDDLFSNKANAHQADNSFAKMDFDAIKANLPTTPASVALPKTKSTSWFGLNTIIASIAIIIIATGIYFYNNTSKAKDNNALDNNIANTKLNDSLNEHTVADTVLEIKLNVPMDSTEMAIQKKQIVNIDTTKNKILNTATNLPLSIGDNKENNLPIKSFFEAIKSKSQFFTINTARDTFITCKNGTTLAIDANTFTTLNKSIVNGIVQLEVKEAYSFTDIIANGLHTVSNGNLLESAGMLFMNATQNNTALDINIKQPIVVTMPTKNKKNGMQLFYLDKNANDNLIEKKSTWIANGQKQDARMNTLKKEVKLDIVLDSETDNNISTTINNEDYKQLNKLYQFSIRNFGWINCDRFSNIKTKTNVEIKLHEEIGIYNSRSLLIFPKIKSVIELYNYQKSLKQQNLPIGEEAYFISFKTEKEKVLTIIQKITITSESIQADAYKDIPTSQVKATLDALGSVQ